MEKYKVTKVGQALAAATAETVLQIVAAANRRVKLKRIVVSFNGVSPSNVPVLVELWRQTGAGTSSAGTVEKLDPAATTAITTARIDFTVEPTSNDNLLEAWYLTPNGGLLDITFPDGQEPLIPASGRAGLLCTAPDAVSVTVSATIEE